MATKKNNNKKILKNMPKITEISTKPLLNAKAIISVFLGVIVLTSLSTIYFLYSIIIISPTKTSTINLDNPLINYSFSNGSLNNSGSIANTNAVIEGNKVFWQKLNEENPNYPLTLNGLIGYWKLDNSLADSSAQNNTALSQGGISCTNNPGFLNQGCTFGQQGQYLDISTVKTSVNPNQGTISIWAYPTDVETNRYVIEGAGLDSDRYYIQWTGGQFRVVRGNPGAVLTLLTNVELNKWYHLTLSWDESKIYGYVNGQLKGSMPYTSTKGSLSRFYIGIQKATDNRSFPGNIDEVAFFERKLTDSEVLYVYNNAKSYINSSLGNGLVGYWKLDNSLADSSAQNNTALSQGGISCTNNPGFLNQGCTFGEIGKYLDISSVKTSVNSSQGTISVWAYPTETGTNRYVIEGMGSDTDRYYIQWANNQFRLVRGNPAAIITLASDVELNKWYHLTFSWDESKIYGYLNGELKGSINYTSTKGDLARFYIGIQKATDNRSFPGNIDEVRFYSRTLSASEVNSVYNYEPFNSDSLEKFLYFENTDESNYGRLRVGTSLNPMLNITEAFTIEAEVYLNNYPISTQPKYTVYTDSSTVTGEGNNLFITTGGKVTLYANTGNTKYEFISPGQVPLNKWFKVVASFNDKTKEMSILIDNIEYGTDTPKITENVAKRIARPYIGGASSWRDSFNGGYIKNLKVWNKSFLSGQYQYEKFIRLIKDGFDRDLAIYPKAKWLGSGTLETLHIEAYPDVTFVDGAEGNKEMVGQVSLDSLIGLRSSSPIIKRRAAAWAAWTDSEGLINLVINTPLYESEKQAINALDNSPQQTVWDINVDWVCDIKNFIGMNRFADNWITKTNKLISHIYLGKVGDVSAQNDFSSRLEILKSIKILDNIQKTN